MDSGLRDRFIDRWQTYFPGAGLPIAYFYTDQARNDDRADTQLEHRCLIGNLGRVRQGHSFVYDTKTAGCSGGKRYSGLNPALRPKFEYFLSCGIPGELDGERYKKSPDLVLENLKMYPAFEAPGACLIFKRWDKLAADEEPMAVIFFATPDVLSGLFTLANFDLADPYGVVAPFGAGCASILYFPYAEAKADAPRCVLGMFDVSARPHVPSGELTFTVPINRFRSMVAGMDESFLITASWNAVSKRLQEETTA
jgi:hypothetical protein